MERPINYQTYKRKAGNETIKVRLTPNGSYYREDGTIITKHLLRKYYSWVKDMDNRSRKVHVKTTVNGFKIRMTKQEVIDSGLLFTFSDES
jgi:hypothetical protein